MFLGRDCPCGSAKKFTLCCEPYVLEMVAPATPELLMRARYCAFTRRRFAFLTRTMTPEALQSFSLSAARRDAPYIRWRKLHVISSYVEGLFGMVEFKAYYSLRGRLLVLHEKSLFEKRAGVWLYAGYESIETLVPSKEEVIQAGSSLHAIDESEITQMDQRDESGVS